MQRKHQNDSDRAVCQPFRNVNTQASQKSRCTADTFGLKHSQPCLRLTPGRNHVRDNNRKREKLFKRQVSANHKPCEHRTERNRQNRNANTDQQRIEQRLEQQLTRQFASQQAVPIVKSEFAGRAACRACITLRQYKGGRDHVQQRQHNQIGQKDNRDQYNNVVRIGHNLQNLIFDPF